MAGEGSRFLKDGINIPKPMILFKQKMLFQRAIESIKGIKCPRKYSFIVREEHIENFEIDRILKNEYPEANIFSVIKTTRGAVETCLLAESAIDVNEAVLIIDCDLEFESKTFNRRITELLNLTANKVNGGVLVSFKSDKDRYSYAQVDDASVVLRTAEKEVISNNALIGAYFFSNAKDFVSAAKKLLNTKDFDKNEYYVSLLYNHLIKNGDTIWLTYADKYHSYGTPEELKQNY